MEVITIDNEQYAPHSNADCYEWEMWQMIDTLSEGEYFVYRDKYIYRTRTTICNRSEVRACYQDDTANNWAI